MGDVWRGLRVFVRLVWKADPRRAAFVLALLLGNVVFNSFNALFLKIVTDGVLARDVGEATLGAILFGMFVASVAAGTMLAHSHQQIVNDRAALLLEQQLMTGVMTLPGIEHHERPEYLNRLTLLRSDVSNLVSSGWAGVDLLSVVVQAMVTGALLASVHPVLVLLAVFVVPSVFLTSRAQRLQQRTEEELAETGRAEQHLLALATHAAPSKEVRVFALREEVHRRSTELWNLMLRRRFRARARAAALGLAGWMVFTGGYVAAIVFTAVRAVHGDAAVGDVVLVVAAGSQVHQVVGGAVGMISRGLALTRSIARYIWLQDYATEERSRWTGGSRVPTRLVEGIELRNVTFRYPDTEIDVVSGIDLAIPAGSTIALVGDNGAGKSTIVKLICGFYQPTDGTITVDGEDLGGIDIEEWRTRLSGVFQDFARFEFLVRESVGVGRVEDIGDSELVRAALERGDAAGMVDALATGIETQLGRDWGGVELSGGQWQKVALCRSVMRRQPLVVVLDEPSSSLDAAAEHELFERYTATRDATLAHGGITILVSHRFSTVKMADRIVVIEGGRIVEVGTHDELLRLGGIYAELYMLQARGYAATA